MGFLILEGVYLGSLAICVITTFVKGKLQNGDSGENFWSWTNETNDPSQSFQHYTLGFGFLAMFFLLHSGKHKADIKLRGSSMH